MNGSKPLKAKNLKVIDYKGTLYATFDGSKIWKLEKYVFRLLMECDGKQTLDQIVQKIAEKSGLSFEEVKIGIKPILDEFEREKFITYI